MARRLTLRDGAVVEVRALRPGDRAALAAAIDRLSPRSRYLRFATPKPGVSERELDVLLDLDHHDREALLAIDPATRRGVGVARFARFPGEDDVVDVAVTVADEWQGRGLGRALLELLVARARAEGHTALHADVLSANAPSIALLRGAGFRPVPGGGGGVLSQYERRLGGEVVGGA
jgi:RimJ/RimL family protein N-acetyltransferase